MSRRSIGEVMLDVKNISLSFGGVKALTDISFNVREHEIRAIIGPNGAGKTSFFNLLSGVRQPTRGEIFFGNQNITSLPMHDRAKLGLARTFQTSSVFTNLTCLENVRIVAQSLWQSFLARFQDFHA